MKEALQVFAMLPIFGVFFFSILWILFEMTKQTIIEHRNKDLTKEE